MRLFRCERLLLAITNSVRVGQDQAQLRNCCQIGAKVRQEIYVILFFYFQLVIAFNSLYPHANNAF
jgi:hypothetical protein